MYESIGIQVDRFARVEKLDRGLTLPANNRVFIPLNANDFVEWSSASVQPASIYLDMSTETHFTSHIHVSLTSPSLSFSCSPFHPASSHSCVLIVITRDAYLRIIASTGLQLANGSVKVKASH